MRTIIMDMDNRETDSAEVLDRVQAWRQQGAQLYEKLLADRSVLIARLKEIDAALALLPGAKPALEGFPTEPTAETLAVVTPSAESKASDLPLSLATLKKLSMPQLVKVAVHHHPMGITASGVIEFARRALPKATPGLVHSGLYRNLESGDIRSEGTRGTRVYFPAVKAQEADVDR
ncbi:MAG: hypothetical protein ABJE95_33690 [Byssovorax sp.]